MKLVLALLLVVYCILAAAMPESISQDGITESGPFKNKVSGSGSSAQTFSQSTTEITTTDGRTLVSNNSNFQSNTSNGYTLEPRSWIIAIVTMSLILYSSF
ncbi:hypothetical protein V8B55DRAFT_1138192 [Mucor lusitanicus]|uniref:Uncharacterized protein n=2 Tax=Mucor circinelloides f. lusitanicus TaxID=29924 RepID=A0A162QJY0_MUCCL|nr:hypothetical protein FB192DRAFT_1382883 [Mucor lusitanicus]OAD00119.1 hypothetical protein MUCCIDRAFT_113574 [Mucor lusitanicus CBS 277.49]